MAQPFKKFERLYYENEAANDAAPIVRSAERTQSGLQYVFNETIIEQNTGAFLPRSKYLASVEDHELVLKQTRELADKLEAVGYKAKLQSSISMIMDVTGEVFEVECWRNINVLPAVAQKNRREMLRDLEHYFDRHGKQYWRYAVITFGDRLPAFSDLAGAVRAAKARLRKWRHLAKINFGVTFGFIGFEFPRCPKTGTYHLHVNVLYKTPLFIDKGERWRKFTHEFFGSWWKDAGQITNLREMLKYPFKPNDISGCEGEEVRWLAEQMFNLRITELLGPINELRKQRKEAGLKVAFIKGKPVLRTPYKRKKTEAELAAEEAQRAYEESLEGEPVEVSEKRSIEAYNIVIGRVMPSFRSTPWAQSATLVFNYHPEPFWQRDRDRLDFIRANQLEARALWDAKGCPDPQTAMNFASACRTAENVVALSKERKKAREARASGEAHYIVHNETISVPAEFEDLLLHWEGDEDSVVELWSEPEKEPPKRSETVHETPAPELKFLKIFFER